MKAQALFLVSLLFTNLLHGQESTLNIAVIAGAAGREVINQKVRVDPVVQVEDETGKPVAGAQVIFALPDSGPGGVFENGGPRLSVLTDADGKAVARGIRANHLTGPFDIKVTASLEGRTGTATISETNIRPPRSNGAFGISTRTWILVGLGLVVIAGGIIAAKKLTGGRNPNVLTATPGTPVVGGPPQ